MTSGYEKTNEGLLKDLEQARRRIAELEALEAKRFETEKALRETERMTRAILDQTFQFIGLMTPDGKLIEANRSSLEFGGLDASQVLGKNFWETPWWTHSEEQQKKLEDNIRRAAGGELVRFEAWHPTPGGDIAFVDVSLKPVLDDNGQVVYIIPEGREITEMKQAAEEVQKLALAVKHSSELVNMATLDGMMIFLNQAGSDMLGIEPGQVESTNFMDVIPEHLVDLVTDELLPALMRGETWKGELQYRNLKTDDLRDAHVIAYTVPDPNTGEPLYLANVSMDITENKRAERERQALQSRVQHTQKLESLGVLAGGIAHDFNNLLTGILGNAELALLQMPPGSEVHNSIDGIRSASIRAAELCKQMLAYSGKGRFVTEVISLSGVVVETMQMLKTSIPAKVNLVFNLEENAKSIEADETQISQIVLNLLTNAIEAIGNRNGVINVNVGTTFCNPDKLSSEFIDGELSEGEYSFFEVIDNGGGIDSEVRSKIFDPFFSTKFTGRGLGLSAVLGIIRGHGGSIHVSSEPRQGTSFKVFLPATDAQPAPAQNVEDATSEWQGDATILLVDDENVVRKVGLAILRNLGFKVLIAVNGIEALEMLRERGEGIDLVLLDLTMPKMSGEATLERMREMGMDVPVVICSGYDEYEVAQRFPPDEISGFIGKPFHLNEMKTKLRKVLG